MVDAGNDGWLFDFDKDAFSRILLDLEMTADGVITVETGECLCNGSIDSAPGGYRRYFRGEYAVKNGKNSFEVFFPPHQAPNPKLKKCLPPDGIEIMPLRYVKISGENITAAEVARLSYFGGFNDEAADFESSSAPLNELWDFCKYSIKATNAFECYIDGDRERLPYEGDAYINQLGHFCCDADYAKAARTIDRLLVTPTWPIEWRLLMPVIVRDYVLYSGNTSYLEKWKDLLDETLFPGRYDENGLLPERFDHVINNEVVRTIIDWPVLERDGCEFASPMTVPNSYLYEALRAMYELYGEIGYMAHAEQVRGSLHRILKKDGVFVDSYGSNHSSIHTLTIPVAFNVAAKEDFEALKPLIAAKNMPCSVYAAQYVLDACFICGLEEHAINLMTRRGERSWLGMIDQGSTISMEAWSNELKPNQDWNHAWGAAPANLIPRRLCGIRPLKAGFTEFIVEPKPGKLEFFRYRQPTPCGAVTVEYDRNTGTAVIMPDGRKHYVTGKSQIFRLAQENRKGEIL